MEYRAVHVGMTFIDVSENIPSTRYPQRLSCPWKRVGVPEKMRRVQGQAGGEGTTQSS